jgi:2-polyprenyl-3-methyl-5-hydroxy-6-metoxy-1,4-benzoquinol methylase
MKKDRSADERFRELTFADFRRLAQDDSLSAHEKIGFPDSYREGKGPAIVADIRRKLPALDRRGARVLDIGPGCGEVARLLIEHGARHDQEMVLVDSPEMLAQLPDLARGRKLAGYYPRDCGELAAGPPFDVILAYSVFHYVFKEMPYFEFVDFSLALLAPGGGMLIGDIPNLSMRRRFFASEAGVRFHKAFTGSDQPPAVAFNTLEPGAIDDAVVLSIVERCRGAGFHAYVVPQAEDLPMANRREDVLIVRP